MDKLFWARPEKVAFAFARKPLEHLECRETLCVRRLKFLNALNEREYKILTEQIHCLCNNVIYRLSAVTNQSTNNLKEQTLHLNTSQLGLNQDPTVCHGYSMHYIKGRLEENNVSVLLLNVSS